MDLESYIDQFDGYYGSQNDAFGNLKLYEKAFFIACMFESDVETIKTIVNVYKIDIKLIDFNFYNGFLLA